MHLSTTFFFPPRFFFLVFHQCFKIITSIDVHWICTNLYMYKQVFVCSFPFLFDAYRHSVSYLCYIHWYAKINTLNICNHLATSYSHIPKTCAFDCYTNTCINISTFLEQFCLWSKHFFFSNLRYKNSCIISISFQEFGATHSTHANTHMKGINFTLNLLQSVIHIPPPSLKGEHSLNMAVLMLSKTYKYILYNKQFFELRQHSSLVSIEIPSITISLFSIFVNTEASVNSQ